MAVQCFNFKRDKNLYTYNDSEIFLSPEGCRLRSQTGSHSATYLASAIITLPEVQILSIDSFWAIGLVGETPSGTSVGFQISNDGGTTWYYWNGSVWSTTVSDFSTLNEVEENIETFIATRIMIKLKLSSSTNNLSTPLIKEINLSYKLKKYNPMEDLERSVRRFFQENLKIPLTFLNELESDTDQVTIDTDFTVIEVTSAYNITTDPDRLTNIFSSNIDKVVTLSSAQSTGDIIEINFKGKCGVSITRDYDIHLAEIPEITLRFGNLDEIDKLCGVTHIINKRFSTSEVLIEEHFLWSKCQIQAHPITNRELDATRACGFLSDLVENNLISSRATGDAIEVSDSTPYNEGELIGQYHDRYLMFEVCIRIWNTTYIIKKLSEGIQFSFGTMEKQTEEVNV